jgi:uncharacterized protein YjdB
LRFNIKDRSEERMKILICRTLAVGLVLIAILAGTRVAVGQDTYKLNYFSNNVTGAPDATFRIDNPGLTFSDLCAMIYVFDSDQQMSECCGCLETHNNLSTLSLQKDLMGNPLTGIASASGTVTIVSTTANNPSCDPTEHLAPAGNLRAWATHIENPTGGSYPITESEFSDTPLDARELASLEANCAYIKILGSGKGTCVCSLTELTVTVTPATLSLTVGQMQQFAATANYSDGSTRDVSTTAIWASSAEGVATISATGLALAVSGGMARISATLSGVTGTASLTVAPTLKSIAVKPSTAGLTVGQTQQFAATGTYGDGSIKDITSSVTWTSSAQSVATIGASSGLAVGIGPGIATIQASLSSASVPPATANLSVTSNGIMAPAVSGIAAGAVVRPGSTIQITLQLPDGYTSGLLYTTLVQPAVAKQAPFAVSLAIPVNAIGIVPLIPAGIDAAGILVLGSPISLDIEPSSSPSIAVTPATLQFAYTGDQITLAVYGSSGDYAYQYLSPSTLITYASQNPSVASVDATGVVTAVSPGSTQVKVTFGSQAATVPVLIPQLIPGDLNGNGVVDSEDVLILSLYIGQKATTPKDARDLNHDGVIDGKDLAILNQQCGAACN